MSKASATAEAQLPQSEELLAWENLGAQPAARAFGRSLRDLLVRPRRFFRAMAVTGGLHEPVAFFAIILTAAIVMAFPATLAYLGLAAPGEEAPSAAHTELVFVARSTGLLLVLLPLAVLTASAAMLLLGSLFHAGGKAFGSRNWEGSVSIWLYSAGAALVPPVAAACVVFVVSLAGYLLSLAWPGARETGLAVARWTATIVLPAGALAGVGLFVGDTLVGCTQAFALDTVVGIAAGTSGLALVLAVAVGVAESFAQWGAAAGLIAAGVGLCAASAIAAAGVIASRRAERNG